MRAPRGWPIIVCMGNHARSADSVAKAAGVLLVIVLINVLPRVVGFPDVDLPSISLPEAPDWAHTGVDVVHTVVKVKNWVLAAVVTVVVVGVAVDQRSKGRAR
jgi:hypothetical protein